MEFQVAQVEAAAADMAVVLRELELLAHQDKAIMVEMDMS
jgi:hypothetical protein